MIEQLKQIEKLLGGVRINTSELISNSFNINCIKIRTNSNKSFIVKFYEKKKYKFNSIISETKNLQYFKEKNLNYFPDIIKANEDFLVMEYLINNSTKQGDIVFDSFCGSGSTLIACEKLQRTCYGVELDPKYCDVIVKRWEQWTGQKATKK